MKTDEGYIKYECNWSEETFDIDAGIVAEINNYRDKLLALNMIGKIPDGPGFGNISVRHNTNEFFISGTNTGHLKELKAEHLALVNRVNIDNNILWCKGKTKASSESMSHFIVYSSLQNVNAVIHVHHKKLWQKLIGSYPTTSNKIAYGTPEMANEIKRLAIENPDNKLIILGGHEDGILAYGESLQQAFQLIEKEYVRFG